MIKKLVLLFLSILVVIGGTGCMSSKDKVLNYLEDKYGEKFTIEDVKKGSKLFPEYGKDKIFAYPEGKPELIFQAGESASKKVKYYDTYIPAIWGQELTDSLKKDIEADLPKDSLYKVYVGVGDKFDVSMKNMSIYDYMEKNPNMGVVLEVAIKTSGQPDLKEYSDGLYRTYEKLKSLHVKYYTLSVGFVDESENVSDYIRTAGVNNIPWSNFGGKIYGYLIVDETFNIDGPENLPKYYEVKE